MELYRNSMLLLLLIYSLFILGSQGNHDGYTVTIVVDPSVDSTNVIEFLVGSNITLTCMVTPTPPSDSEFSWSCSTGCFVDMEIEQSVNITELELTDSGELNCSVIIDDVEYTSETVELRITEECQPDRRTCRSEFFRFGISVGDSTILQVLDGISPQINLTGNFCYDEKIESIYVNENGVISFNRPFNYSVPSSFPITGDRFIAPFWANIDIRRTGNIYYRQIYDFHHDYDLLYITSYIIRDTFPGYDHFRVTNLFVITWDAVGYHPLHSDKTNTFQCLLATDGVEIFVWFLYGDIQWTATKSNSGDIIHAVAGYNAGDGINFFTIPGSLTPSIIDIIDTSNIDNPGVWLFPLNCSNTTEYSGTIDDIAFYTAKYDDIFESIVGYNITMTCLMAPTPPSDSEFYWSCQNGCSFDKKVGRTLVIVAELTDSGRLNCTAIIHGLEYVSESIELRILDECQPEIHTCRSEFYPIQYSSRDELDEEFANSNSGKIELSEYFVFYDERISRIYVSDNGIIHLGNVFDSHAPHSLPINKYKFVAPFWADADIRNSLQGQTGFHIGDVYYSQSTNPDLLARATNEIKEVFPQSEDFIITSLFIATWREVAYFSMHVNKTNTFQCILATNGFKSFVIFMYEYEKIQWTTSDSSGGIRGLGGTEAVAGINAGDGVNHFTIPGSSTPDIINIDRTSNVGRPGVWMFQVGNIAEYRIHLLTESDIAPINGIKNVLEFPVGSNITLTCMVTPTPPSDSKFRWSCSNGCFIDGKSEQSFVIELVDQGIDDLNCSVIINDVKYTTKTFDLQVLDDCESELYTCESEFYPFGYIQNDDTLPNIGISKAINFSVDFKFYDDKIGSVYIFDDGIIQFDDANYIYWAAIKYFDIDSQYVAPYVADVYIKNGGGVFYRQTTDPNLLQRATSEIRAAFSVPQNVTMQSLLIVTWFRVSYFSTRELTINKTNTFQCVLATSGEESFVIFLYAHGRIQWTTGDEAVVAINAGDGVNHFSIPGSQTPDIDETSNVGIPGVWMFQVGKRACQPELYTCLSEFYPFGVSQNDDTLRVWADSVSSEIYLSEDFIFYDEIIRSVYVSDNGIISFNRAFQDNTPKLLPRHGYKFVAPYWADVSNTGTGTIYYRQTNDTDLRARATSEIRAVFPAYQNFSVTNLFIVTWDAVGYYPRGTDKTNTFQCVLATDGVESFVIFLYAFGEIQWTTGDSSGGDDGLGGDEAVAGINGGDLHRYYNILGSQTPDIINIDQTSNVEIPGVWMFQVGKEIDIMDCDILVERCRGKCKRLYKKVRRFCTKLLKRGSDCFQSCTTAVEELLKDEIGNEIWRCGNPKGKLRKLQNAYDKKC